MTSSSAEIPSTRLVLPAGPQSHVLFQKRLSASHQNTAAPKYNALGNPPNQVNNPANHGHKQPLPTVSLTPSTLSPTYGRARIVGTVTDPATNLEFFRVHQVLHKCFNVSPRDILKYVSAAEHERFECALAQQHKEQENASRVAQLSLRSQRRRPGRPRKNEGRGGSSAAESNEGNGLTASEQSDELAGEPRATQSPNTANGQATSLQTASRLGSSQTRTSARSSTQSSDNMNLARGTKRSRSPVKNTKAWRNHNGHVPIAIRQGPSTLRSSASSASKESMEVNKGKGRAVVPNNVLPAAQDKEEFEVEKIIGDHVVDGERLYIVKWVGYDELTEEPPEHLEGSEELMAGYWMKKMKKLGGHAGRA